ncbi:MAG TPA: chromosome segregation protein SMC [Cytophagales bacterium]|nr:chromosome segregation protein SMC [Cytophagales bacterium]
MEENENFNVEKKSNKRFFLIAIIIVLLIINAVKFYLDYRDSKEKDEIISSKNVELEQTYDKLENVSQELEGKIEEIKRLGGNVDSLILIQKELEADKIALKRSGAIAKKNYDEIKDKLEGYEYLLRQKDQEIEQLKAHSKVLFEENKDLKTQKNVLSDSISKIAQTREQLAEKLATASVLKAENINVVAISDKGKEKDGGEYKSKQIDKIKVSFNLAENKVAKIEGKEILLSIVDPNGSPLYDVSTGSGTFVFNGKEQFYSAKQEILFDNTMQQLSFIYDKGSEFDKGSYKVDIYAEGNKIGTSSFVVK